MGKKKYVEATGWEKMKSQQKANAKSGFEKRMAKKMNGEPNTKRKFKGKERHVKCYFCRKTGHSVANCKARMNSESNNEGNAAGTGICFRCGSKEHNLKNCPVKVKPGDTSLPFASCYVCKQQGHLSSQCPQNERGLYPNGGCCKYCGSVRHLARDCNPANKKEKDTVEIGVVEENQGADDDDVFIALKRIQDEKAKKLEQKKLEKPQATKKKVVSF